MSRQVRRVNGSENKKNELTKTTEEGKKKKVLMGEEKQTTGIKGYPTTRPFHEDIKRIFIACLRRGYCESASDGFISESASYGFI